jgi:hypothetical protein
MQDEARIIKVKKNPDGDITDVMLENGNVYSINEALIMAKDGLISGVNAAHAKKRKRIFKKQP